MHRRPDNFGLVHVLYKDGWEIVRFSSLNAARAAVRQLHAIGITAYATAR